jgi:protein-tyrosine phosphatase
MPTTFSILTVCIGNVCRSPLMERLLRRRLSGQVTVNSAGVRAVVDSPMDATAAAELHRLGGMADGFLARQLQPTHVEAAGLVLTATSAVRSRVLEDVPSALRRTFTLLELANLVEQAPDGIDSPEGLVAWAAVNRSLAAGEPLDIVDPIGASPEVHRQAADAIDEGTARVAAALKLAGVTASACAPRTSDGS